MTISRVSRRKTAAPQRSKIEFVEALARGLAVLGAFDEAYSEMTLSEVASRTRMSPATARRSLHTLEALGYLRFVNKKYVLAAHVLTLGAAYVRAAGVNEALMPELRRLVDLFGDASSVSVLDGSNVLYIAHCSEQRAARRTAGIGVTYPAYATSMGRVLISRLRDDQIAAYLGELKPLKLTEHTVTDIGKLRQILLQTRRLGYSAVVDELDYGIVVLSEGLRIIHINEAAQTELDDQHPLQMVGGELRARLASAATSGLSATRDLADWMLAQLQPETTTPEPEELTITPIKPPTIQQVPTIGFTR